MKVYKDTCPACGAELILDDSETEVHCGSCGFNATVEAMVMCEVMCPCIEEE